MEKSKLSNAIQLLPTDTLDTIRKKSSKIKPSKRQMEWINMEFTAFVHFGVNTFTDKEWGDGTENPKIFNPSDLDADEFVSACKDAEMRMVILTCKHHDGFCLWPSKYTEHSVKNSPYKNGKGDVVREFANACKKHGLKFGVYLSPWDRHDSRYGKGDEYNDYYINQLTELLTEYGEVSDVWLDGACAEGPNGNFQKYDWARIYRTVRELAPDATISDVGPDSRWCGNEAGRCRQSEWNVIPIPNTDEYLPEYSSKTADAFANHNVLPPHYCTQEDLGSLEELQEHAENSDRLFWYPAQVNFSIRPGWFYHAHEDLSVRSIDFLLNTYLNAVGGNTQMLLNIPPDKRGRINEVDASRLRVLGKIIRKLYSKNFISYGNVSASGGENINNLLYDNDTFFKASKCNGEYIEITFDTPCEFDILMLKENIINGQKIEKVDIEYFKNGTWNLVSQVTTIGSKRFIRIDNSVVTKLRISIVESRDIPEITQIALYKLPQILNEPIINRNDEGYVTLSTNVPSEIRYTLDGSEPNDMSTLYTKPFEFLNGGTIKAKAFYSENTKQNAIETAHNTAGRLFGVLKKDWTIYNSSAGEEIGFESENILNSDPNKYVKSKGNKYSVTIDMKKEYSIKGFLYQPVSEGYDFNFNCVACRLYISNDGRNFVKIDDTFYFGNLFHNPVLYTKSFSKVYKGRYLRFETVECLRPEKVVFSELSIIPE